MSLSDQLPKVTIYTDGSCCPNPGPGGWGAVILDPAGETRNCSGRERETTNNRMELTAALRALQQLGAPHAVELFTDSRYVRDGICQWLANWQRRGWTTITGEEVRNRDLWQELAAEIGRHQVQWHWVKGHGSNQWNILADELAGASRERQKLPLDDENSVHLFLGITWRQKIGAGAWAGVMRYRRHLRVIGGVRREGSGNSLHIFSAVEAIGVLTRPLPVHLYTNSGYLKDGAGSWLGHWQAGDWLTRDGREVSNRHEWQSLATMLGRYPVTFHLVDKIEPPCHLLAAKEVAKGLLADDEASLQGGQ